MPLQVFFLKITACKNPNWKVGNWICWRPEDHECIGPGGWAQWDQCVHFKSAEMFVQKEHANTAAKKMLDDFGVHTKMVTFEEKK